jgi:hypothetical protein
MINYSYSCSKKYIFVPLDYCFPINVENFFLVAVPELGVNIQYIICLHELYFFGIILALLNNERNNFLRR